MTAVCLLLFGLTSCFCVTADQVIAIQPILPANGPACPGQDVTFNCTVTSSNNNMQSLTLAWMYRGIIIVYQSDGSQSGLDNNVFTAVFYNLNNAIISTATIPNIPLSHHNSTMQCLTTEATSHLETIKIAGAGSSPSNLTITATMQSASLTWLPPPNAPNCIFNYTINITNSDSILMTVHSSTNLLTLTGLTQGQIYSFAVVVTDSTGQHGPWSEQLTVEYNNASLLPVIMTTKTHQEIQNSSTTVLASNDSGASVQLYSCCCSQTPENELKKQMDDSCLVIVTASTLVSGVLSAVIAAIVTSIIACCLMKRAKKKTITRDGGVKGFTNELASAIYDVPVIKEQCLNTQDNVAYGGKIQNNNTYEEIH